MKKKYHLIDKRGLVTIYLRGLLRAQRQEGSGQKKREKAARNSRDLGGNCFLIMRKDALAPPVSEKKKRRAEENKTGNCARSSLFSGKRGFSDPLRGRAERKKPERRAKSMTTTKE